MAESCANSEGQGSSLCGLQMTCSSDMTNNLKRQLNHGNQETLLDDSRLHLDSTELKRGGGVSYNHTNDNGYSENNSPMDMSVSGKCIDSYQAPDSHKTDKGMTSSTESSTLLSSQPLTSSSSAKPSLSSTFMISSLLSTKRVSSFTTILTQACSGRQSQPVKVANSTSNCDSVPSTTLDSSTKLFETKENTLSLETDSQNELGNMVVHDNLNRSKRGSLDGNTGRLSAHLDTEQRSSAEIQNTENSVCTVSALREDDVEDMQVEETSSLTLKDPVLETELISPGTMKESGIEPLPRHQHTGSPPVTTPIIGNSSSLNFDFSTPGGGACITEVKTKKMVEGQSVSSLQSDVRNKSDVWDENNVLDVSGELQAQNSTDDDVLLIYENAEADNDDSVLGSNKVDTSGWQAGVNKSGAVPEHTSADSANSDGSKLVNNGKIMNSQDSRSIDACSSKNTFSDDQTILDYSVRSQQSNISDDSVLDISDLENAQIQPQVRLGIQSDSGVEVVVAVVSNGNSDLKAAKLHTQDAAALPDQSLAKRIVHPCTVAESEALETEACKLNPVADTSSKSVDDNVRLVVNSQLPEVNKLNMSSECEENRLTCENTSKLKVSTHSTNVSDSLVNSPETNNSSEDIEMHLGNSLDKTISADRIQDKDANSVIVGHPLVSRRESLNDQGTARDDIHFLDNVNENEPANRSTEKFSFKNILFMPKDKTASKKNTAGVEESELLTSTDTVLQGHSETTDTTVGDKTSVTQSAALDTASNQSHHHESPVKVEPVESVANSDTANERKRFQTENFSSASKRSRLDSVVGKDEKVVKVDTAKSEKVSVAEKCLPSTEVKSTVKPKEDKAVLLSNEVLQTLITLRVKAFIKNQKQANIDRLNLRTRGMQSASNLWKETTKHLEKSVLELTALNQKLESRKAHLIAVKRLASRSMSTQTSEDNVGPASSAAPSPAASTPVQRTPPVTIQPTVHRTGRPGRPPLYTRTVTNIPPTVPQPPVAAQEKTQPVNKTIDTPVHTNSVNLIDLTDDEETSRSVIAKTSQAAALQPPNQAASKPYMGGKTGISSPANGYVRQSSQMQGTPGTLVGAGSQIVQSSISGSQHLTTSNSADTQFHLVTPINPVAQHSGTANPLGSRPGGASATYSPAGPSNMPTNPRNLPQNPAPPAVASPSASGGPKTAALSLPPSFLISHKHPAPLPSNMDTGNAPPTAKKRPPKPSLKISRVSQGIVLSWNMPSLFDVEKISSYQLYAYQESDSATPRSSLWKKVGEVTALPLPMACTLTQFQEGNKYHFAVRAVDQFGRCGCYSDPSSIYLGPKS